MARDVTQLRRRWLLRAPVIFDGLGDEPIEDGAILIEDAHISAVDRVAAFAEFEVADVVQAPGAVLPGMIDLHSHVSFRMDSLRTPYAEIADSSERIAIRATGYLEAKLLNGVTGIRAMSERSYVAAELRDAVRDAVIRGPDMWVAGLGIKVEHGWGHTATACVGEEEIRGLIRGNIRRGAAFTKVFLTNNGPLSRDRAPSNYFSDPELAAVIDESHRAGLPVAAHCHGGPALRRFVSLGGDTVEHGFFLTDDDLDNMAKAGTWLVGTIGYLFGGVDLTTDPDGLAARAAVGDVYRRAVAGGVRFALGTDDGVAGIGHELRCLVDQGFELSVAIRAGTSAAAACLGAADRGVLAVGLRADIALLAGDPRADSRVLEDVVGIVKAGELIRLPERSKPARMPT